MASKLIPTVSHEAENQYELFLNRDFEALEPQLRPPFPLIIPNSQEYLQLNRAVLYGVFCEPHFSKIHIKHLHAAVTDGYALFVSLLVKIVNESYLKLIDSTKNHLIWVTKEMVDVSAVGFVGVFIKASCWTFRDGNVWLCFEHTINDIAGSIFVLLPNNVFQDFAASALATSVYYILTDNW